MGFTILIIDDDEVARKNVSEFLRLSNYEVLEASTLKEGVSQISLGNGDVILLDVNLPDGNGLHLLEKLTAQPEKIPVIMITGYGDIEMAVEAMKTGAHDFIIKPFKSLENLEKSIQRATDVVQLRRQLSQIKKNLNDESNFIVGKSEKFQNVLTQAVKAAKASVSVLITGETGSGKEIVANYIYRSGSRAQKPWLPISCPAIQPTVLESELFGYEAGAFTGAEKRKHGLMEIADGSILFLDEISSMPMEIQAKLLRAIEERSFMRVGGTSLINVDIQIIAASNRNIMQMIEKGEFREDLYYRLKVVDLHIPPLRERKEDIPELIGFFVNKFNRLMGKNVIDVSQDVIRYLSEYDWPGNIRELSNVIQRALLFSDGERITTGDLPLDITQHK